MVKKKKLGRSKDFKADTQTIKKEDVRKLQETFSQYFGSDTDEMKKSASKLRNKVYFFGFIATILFVSIFYLSKNIKFVGI